MDQQLLTGGVKLDARWRTSILQQFGAAIDMLDNAVTACPDDLWHVRLWRDGQQESDFSQFWYVVYHTLFWLDLYLSGSVQGFMPPAPFGLEELDPTGLRPERAYTKDELNVYLAHGREKARAAIQALTDEKAHQRCSFSWGEVSYAELMLYNMRHVQEHAAQLSLILGQKAGLPSRWVLASD
jgi:hypothetical protein